MGIAATGGHGDEDRKNRGVVLINGANLMTQSTQPTDLPTRLAALLATVALNPGMVATAQQERDRGILEALNDIVLRLEAIEKEKGYKEYLDTLLSLRIAIDSEWSTRLAALEAWKETQTGEGK